MTVAPVIGLCVMRIPSFFAALAHFLSILFHVVNIEFLFLLQEYSFIHLISALLVVFSFHRAFSSFILITCVSRERGENVTNKAWWSGKWYRSGLGFRVITQNMRELIIKMLELNKFTFDFVLGHVLLLVMLPLLFVPYIDTLHTSLLFWLKPSRQFKRAIISKRQRRKKNWQVVRYFFLFVLIVATFISLVVIPPLFKSQLLKLQKKLTKMVIAANGSGN